MNEDLILSSHNQFSLITGSFFKITGWQIRHPVRSDRRSLLKIVQKTGQFVGAVKELCTFLLHL